MNRLTDLKKRDQEDQVKPLIRRHDLKEFSKLIRFCRPKLKHMSNKEREVDLGFILGYN